MFLTMTYTVLALDYCSTNDLEKCYRIRLIPKDLLQDIPMLHNTRPLEPEIIHHRKHRLWID